MPSYKILLSSIKSKRGQKEVGHHSPEVRACTNKKDILQHERV